LQSDVLGSAFVLLLTKSANFLVGFLVVHFYASLTKGVTAGEEDVGAVHRWDKQLEANRAYI
jgi:hypothetical protein